VTGYTISKTKFTQFDYFLKSTHLSDTILFS